MYEGEGRSCSTPCRQWRRAQKSTRKRNFFTFAQSRAPYLAVRSVGNAPPAVEWLLKAKLCPVVSVSPLPGLVNARRRRKSSVVKSSEFPPLSQARERKQLYQQSWQLTPWCIWSATTRRSVSRRIKLLETLSRRFRTYFRKSVLQTDWWHIAQASRKCFRAFPSTLRLCWQLIQTESFCWSRWNVKARLKTY